MTRRRASDALHYSLAELAYVLLFLSLGVAALLQVRNAAAAAQLVEYEAEIAFLNELLEETRYGVVPCWRRPEAAVDPVVARVVIHSTGRFTALRTADGDEQTVRAADGAIPAVLAPLLRDLLATEMAYAGERSCYLRMEIENETDGYPVFREVASVAASLGIVVVNE